MADRFSRAGGMVRTTGIRPHAEPPTVLLVDDEPSIANATTTLLRRRGFVVLTAQTGFAALALLRERRVDGLVLDFRLPDVRGDVLYSAAVALQPHLKDRLVCMTGDITEAAQDAMVGVDCAILIKPYEFAELERAVRQMLEKDSDAGGASEMADAG